MRIWLKNKKNEKGFTLVELMIVVAIIGILAVLAVYGVSKYMVNAKTGEARNALGQIAKSAVGAYEEERSEATILAPGSSGAENLHALCAKADNTVPDAITKVADKKYQSSAKTNEDWQIGTKNKGWPCLKFSLTEPQYFMYGYDATTTATGGFNAHAEAILKGGASAATNSFWITGKIVDSQLTVAQQINENEGAATKTVP